LIKRKKRGIKNMKTGIKNADSRARFASAKQKNQPKKQLEKSSQEKPTIERLNDCQAIFKQKFPFPNFELHFVGFDKK